MPGFKKGNKYVFKQGSMPHNKKRKRPKQANSDSKEPLYIRPTKKIFQQVVNDPYTSSEEKRKRSTSAARLLRPKSDKVSEAKYTTQSAVKDKR